MRIIIIGVRVVLLDDIQDGNMDSERFNIIDFWVINNLKNEDIS